MANAPPSDCVIRALPERRPTSLAISLRPDSSMISPKKFSRSEAEELAMVSVGAKREEVSSEAVSGSSGTNAGETRPPL